MAICNGKDGDIKCTTTEIKHQTLDFLILPLARLVEAVGDRCGCRLCNDLRFVQARNFTRLRRRLLLGVVEVGRNCHDSVLDLFSKIFRGNVLQFFKDLGRYLLRKELLLLTINCGG